MQIEKIATLRIPYQPSPITHQPQQLVIPANRYAKTTSMFESAMRIRSDRKCTEPYERQLQRTTSPRDSLVSVSASTMIGFRKTTAAFVFLLLRTASSFGLGSLTTCEQQNHRHRRSLVSPLSLSAVSDTSPEEQQQQQQQHIVIVGGGVGGLAVAARIAAKSKSDSKATQITILEKNDRIGGRCGSFWVDPKTGSNNGGDNSPETSSFRHEEGPSLLLLPKVYHEVFSDCTDSRKSVSDYGLDMVRCAPAYQVVFDDGDSIRVGFPDVERDSPAAAISRQQMDAYEADGATKWDEYMATTAAYLDAGLPNFIEERLDLASLPEFLRRSLSGGGKAWPLKPHSDVLDAMFDSDKLKALASFQDLYVGLEPYRNPSQVWGGVFQSTAPAVFGLLAAIELHPSNKNAGVFAPIGGFQAVTNALEGLAEDLGVGIRCGTTVLGVTNDGVWVKAAESDDGEDQEFIPADLVIVNADLPYAKQSLLMNQTPSKTSAKGDPSEQIQQQRQERLTETFDWDDGFSFSSGVISFYWSLDKTLDDLNTHNVFLSTGSRSEAEASWKVLRDPPSSSNSDDDSDVDAPFNFYVHRSSHSDPSAVPSGCDAIMVLVPCKTLLRDGECVGLPKREAMERYEQQFSPAAVARVREAVLKRFAAVDSLKDLGDHILHEEYRTPATWADRYNLAAGTPFALSHGFAQLSLTRPGPKSSGLPNVLYCGASTRPGNGVPLVLIGAKQVAETAIQSLRDSDSGSE